MLRKLPILLVLLLSSLFVHPAYANEQFSTSIISTYTVHSDGATTVDQRVTLINKTSQFFAKEYTLTIASEDVNNVSGRDSQGDIVKDLHRNNGQTRIFLAFNDVVTGKDQQLTFRISYQTNEVANKQGSIIRVLIPALPESDTLESYSAVLKVPQDFPKVAFFKPKPQKSSEYQYVWHGTALKSLGAIGYFGTSQFYQGKLSYNLLNEGLKPETQQLALPPDTSYQRVFVQSITPQPENIVVDKDRNWLAIYNVPPKTEIDITVNLVIETFIVPRDGFDVDLTEQEKTAYLSPQQFWEVENETIQKLATDLDAPEAIYRYIVNNLSYNYKKLEDSLGRIGAAATLQNKTNAVCTEFTDLFIALSRAVGIPAREANGYAYTEDETLKPLSLVADVLHAWPEYYDENLSIWRPVDPTWGNTTGGVDYLTLLDFDHVVFVYHGLSSSYPLPAGYYRQDSTTEKKQIEIAFAEDIPEETKKPISLRLEFPLEIDTAQKLEGIVRVTNPNNVAYYNIQPKISSNPLKLANKIAPIPVLPPFATYEIEVALASPAQFTPLDNIKYLMGFDWVDNEIQAIYNGVATRTTIKIVPWTAKYIPIVIGGVFVVGLLGVSLFIVRKKL